ncbi:MAG: hypothetical protein J0L92_30505 [Deltaproteobacteria bacterium]|nr:hypothetical protein [Deltaproteobacteria bacterium]
MVVRVAIALALATTLSACLATEPMPGFWPCSSDANCIDSHVCASRAGETQASCVARCDADTPCPEGSRCLPSGTCAFECSFAGNGMPIVACPEGLHCARLRYPLGTAAVSEGLCDVTPTCITSSDCDPGWRCASSDNVLLQGLSNLPCAPLETASGCPAGWINTSLGCLASCDSPVTSVSCPAASTCMTGSLVPFGARESESACHLGYYGAPCRDDSECFVGSCQDIPGGRRQCTETCVGANFLTPAMIEAPCTKLATRAGPLGARLIFECAPADVEDVCVARGGVGSGCRRAEGLELTEHTQDDECGEDLECRGGLCTRQCVVNEDCRAQGGETNPLANGYCNQSTGYCAPVLDLDAICESDEECSTGLCAPPVSPFGAYRCDNPRRPSEFCTRDVECISRRCVGTPLSLRVCGS